MSNMEGLSEQLENYLKEIYELEETKGKAKVSDLIMNFDVSPGTISKAVERLESMGLIKHDRHGITLTDDGRVISERLVRAHRLSERLLTDILGLDWIRAHQIAHKLEHAWPPDVIERIDEVLGRPSMCPHGHPIPGRGKIHGNPLWSEEIGSEKEVMAIVREEEWVLRTVTQAGLRPGSKVKVVGRKDENLSIVVNGRNVEIPKLVALEVLVS